MLIYLIFPKVVKDKYCGFLSNPVATSKMNQEVEGEIY